MKELYVFFKEIKHVPQEQTLNPVNEYLSINRN